MLDRAVEQREILQARASARALAAYFNKADSLLPEKGFYGAYFVTMEMLKAIPENRWSAIIQCYERDAVLAPESAGYVEALKALGIREQREAVACTMLDEQNFTDPAEERKHWRQLNALYRTIMKEYPDIIWSESDRAGVRNLAEAFRAFSKQIQDLWPAADMDGKIALAQAIFRKAFPEDRFEDMVHTSIDMGKLSSASYQGDIDMMFCGAEFENSQDWAKSLWIYTHESMHRRQALLRGKFNDGQISPDHPDYWQARLFFANSRGYLKATSGNSNLRMLAQLGDYQQQPVEVHANALATAAHRIGQTGGEKTWVLGAWFTDAISAVARPVERVTYGAGRLASAIADPGKKKPDITNNL